MSAQAAGQEPNAGGTGSETTNQGGTQAGGQQGGGQQQGGQSPGGQQEQGGSPKTYDESYVRTLRDEAASNRTALRKVEAELKALKDKELSESERKEARIKELEAEMSQVKVVTEQARILSEVLDTGVSGKQAKLIVRLIEPGCADVKAAIEALKTEHPQLFATTGDSGPGRSDTGSAMSAGRQQQNMGVDINEAIRRAAGRRL